MKPEKAARANFFRPERRLAAMVPPTVGVWRGKDCKYGLKLLMNHYGDTERRRMNFVALEEIRYE